MNLRHRACDRGLWDGLIARARGVGGVKRVGLVG